MINDILERPSVWKTSLHFLHFYLHYKYTHTHTPLYTYTYAHIHETFLDRFAQLKWKKRKQWKNSLNKKFISIWRTQSFWRKFFSYLRHSLYFHFSNLSFTEKSHKIKKKIGMSKCQTYDESYDFTTIC